MLLLNETGSPRDLNASRPPKPTPVLVTSDPYTNNPAVAMISSCRLIFNLLRPQFSANLLTSLGLSFPIWKLKTTFLAFQLLLMRSEN